MTDLRVAAKALVIKNDKVLILKRKRTSSNAKIEWDIPGGGIKQGESFEQALHRELKEEANISGEIIDIIRAWNCLDENKILYGVTFAVRYISGDILLSDEHEDYQWMPLSQIQSSDIAKWIKAEAAILQKRLEQK